MKKLLLVLLVVTLASFLFVGCIPVTPSEGEGEGEGEAEICPTVSITSQVVVGGKTYIKGGTQTITVTFAVPTEPVSVWVPQSCSGDRHTPDGIPEDAYEIVMYPNADKTVYTGEDYSPSWLECCEFYVYVLTCDTCGPCKYPYTIDNEPPYAQVEVCIDECDCAGCELTFTSTSTNPECEEGEECCGDDCSGFASWAIDIYDADPFDECCEVPCEVPIASDSGVCPIDFTTACLTSSTNPIWVVVTLVDNVGNETKMLASVEFNPDTCDEIMLTTYGPNVGPYFSECSGEEFFVDIEEDCVDTPDFVVCSDALPN